MLDYFRETARLTDPARRVGWRHRLEQAYRFEIIREVAGDAPLLDLGCGTAALADYLGIPPGRYVGVERCEPLAQTARDAGHEVIVTDFLAPDVQIPRTAVVAVVGALALDDSPDDAARLLAHCFRFAVGHLVVVCLDAEAIERRPGLGDPQLGCIRASVLEAAASLGPWGASSVVKVSETDIAFVAARECVPRLRTREERLEAVLGTPWGSAASAARRAWLALEVGRPEACARELAVSDGRDAELAVVVRSRLELGGGV